MIPRAKLCEAQGQGSALDRRGTSRQAERYRGAGGGSIIRTNAEADGELLAKVATPDGDGASLLSSAALRMRLSARGYHRVLRVARTLADLDHVAGVRRLHIAEALSYRRIAYER